MCITCGCEMPETSDKDHIHENHTPSHSHEHKDVKLETAILAENSQFASENRKFFNNTKILVLNLLSSPGSGKTSLLETTIKNIKQQIPLYVIEGDQQTEIDALRIRSAGAQAYQINTGKTCHLDGHMISHALEHLKIKPNGIMFIENVGNLICPALFDLGEHAKVVIISVTEGEDKPLKYPNMFYSADLIIINKIDLLPYLQFSVEQCIINIRKINSRAKIIQLSTTTQEGLDQWIKWLHLAHSFYLQ